LPAGELVSRASPQTPVAGLTFVPEPARSTVLAASRNYIEVAGRNVRLIITTRQSAIFDVNSVCGAENRSIYQGMK
jgi:hypothetical protein